MDKNASSSKTLTNAELSIMLQDLARSIIEMKDGAQPTTQAVQSQTAAKESCPQDYVSGSDGASSTIPYNGSDRAPITVNSNRGKEKKRKVQVQNPPEKRSRLDDPELSLPEESDMDNDLKDLIGSPEKSVESLGESDDNFDDLYETLSKDVEDDELGPPISDKMAKVFNKIWKAPVKKERYLEKLKKYPLPSNIPLRVKKCNPELWKHRLSARSKTNDLKMQKIQLALHKTNAAMVDNLEHLQQSLSSFDKNVPKKDVRQLVEHSIVRLTDATKILAGASSYTDEVRRDFMSNTLPQDIKTCINTLDIDHDSDLLFGSNFTKRITDWKTSMKTMDRNWSDPMKKLKNFNRSFRDQRGWPQRGNFQKRRGSYKKTQQTAKKN